MGDAVALGRATKLLVEVDVLGVDEEAPRTDAVKPKGKTAAVAFRREYPAGAGSALRKAIAAALQSDEQTDSEVQFAVLSVDAKGEEKELGVAAVSLEALLEKGADHAEAAVPVKDNDGKGAEVGQLTVAVTALAAMKEIDAEVGGEPAAAGAPAAATPPVAVATPTPTATATPPVAVAVATAAPAAAELPVAVATATAPATATEEAPATLKPAMSRLPSGVERSRALAARTGGAAPGAHAPIVVEASELTLSKGVALEKKSKLVVTASALGLDAHASAAADVKVAKASLAPSKDGGRCTFALKHRFRAGAGSKLAAALAAALPTLAEDDCSIELVVSSVDKSGKEGKRIGAATVALKPLLQAGADRTSAPLALLDAAGAEVGQLTCAVTALAALQEIDAGLAATAPERSSAPAAGGSPAEVVVVAEKLELDPSLKLETRIASAILEVDMPGTADEPLRSKPAAVAGRVATSASSTPSRRARAQPARGTRGGAAVGRPGRLGNQLYVYAVDAKGGERELGMAAVSLEALLEKGADHALGAVAVKDAKGVEVGQLTVAVTALAALADRRLARELGGRRRARAAHAREATEGRGQARRRRRPREVDVLGAHTERTPRLAAAGAVGHKGAGTYAISFKQSFDAASGSALHSALLAALQSDEQTDSEVQFAVLSVDAKGEEKGSASRR